MAAPALRRGSNKLVDHAAFESPSVVLRNHNGMEVRVLALGGIVQRLVVPDR